MISFCLILVVRTYTDTKIADDDSNNSDILGLIIGGAIGGVLLLVVVIIIVVCRVKRKGNLFYVLCAVTIAS